MTTIFAPITNVNRGGAVTIIRISGSKALESLMALGISASKIKPEQQSQLFFSKIYDCYLDGDFNIINKKVLDEAVITCFFAPHSFTGENIVELNLHNSPFVIKRTLAILGKIANFRLAEPGEFSKRAFLNGKIDLLQAEAVSTLIASETAIQHRYAMEQISGNVSSVYRNWHNLIVNALSLIEAAIDFPDEELPIEIINQAKNLILELVEEITLLLKQQSFVNKINDGISLAIIGSPNVGKSTFINYLARSEVAITSAIAGTTRDVLQIPLEIAGAKVTAFDTAGIRETTDEIESEGVKRAISKAESADIKIVMTTAEDLDFVLNNSYLLSANSLLIVNKIDQLTTDDKASFLLQEKLANVPNIANIIQEQAIYISLSNKINLDILLDKLNIMVKTYYQENYSEDLGLLISTRASAILTNSLEALKSFCLKLERQEPIEITAEELRFAANNLSKIIGSITVDDVLEKIFSQFCIGK
jgi:tRNA modification GTPase